MPEIFGILEARRIQRLKRGAENMKSNALRPHILWHGRKLFAKKPGEKYGFCAVTVVQDPGNGYVIVSKRSNPKCVFTVRKKDLRKVGWGF